MKILEIQPTATTISGSGAALGGLIDLPAGHDYLTILLEYTKGDETSVEVYPFFLAKAGGIEAQWMDWTAAAGTKTATVNELSLTASGSYTYTFDVSGQALCYFYHQATGGTPTGTLKATVIVKDP